MLSRFSQLLFIGSSSAQIFVVFPLNSQFPPVSVANKEFTFTFAPTTFSANDPEPEYSLVESPSWLSLDAATRTLSGIPSNADLGQFEIELQASTGSGTTAATATLIVLEENPLSGNYEALTNQLAIAGCFSPPSTLLLRPSERFMIHLGTAIFNGVNNTTTYDVLSAGKTPLPAWASFNPDTLLFSGTTPTLLTPQASPQIYSFVVIASQVAGFSQALLSFQISVTNHVLVFKQPLQAVSLFPGSTINVPSLIDQLYRDDNLVPREALTSVSTNQPEWLTLNTHDLSFQGSSPPDADDTFFYVDVTDDQNNAASAIVWLIASARSIGYASETYLGSVDCRRGDYFKYKLATFEAWRAGFNFTADLGNATSWLALNSSDLTIQGVVPVNTPIGHVNISVSLLDDKDAVQIKHLELVVIEKDAISPSQASQSISGSTPSPTISNAPVPPGVTPVRGARRTPKTLALAISLSLTLLIVFMAIGYLLFKKFRGSRRRGLQNKENPSGPANEQSAVVLIKDPLQQKSNTISRSAFVSSTLGLPRHSTGQHYEEHISQTVARNPAAMSSWDEILTDLQLTARIIESGKLSRVTPVNVDGVDIETDLHRFSRLQANPQRSENRVSLASHIIRRGTLDPADSDAQSRGRRTGGLGHGSTLPSAVGYDLDARSIPRQHRTGNKALKHQRFISQTSNPDSNECNVLETDTNQSGREVNLRRSSMRNAILSYGDENDCNHESQQLDTSYQLSSEDYHDFEWFTETCTLDSDDQDLARDDPTRLCPSVECKDDILGIISRHNQSPDQSDIDSQSGKRSELSQKRSLRFL